MVAILKDEQYTSLGSNILEYYWRVKAHSGGSSNALKGGQGKPWITDCSTLYIPVKIDVHCMRLI